MKRAIPIVLVAAAFAGVVTLAVARRTALIPAQGASNSTLQPATGLAASPAPVRRPPSTLKLDPSKAGEMTHGEAGELERIRSTYQSFRVAIAQNNDSLQSSLLSVLGRDRRTALRIAEETLAQARDEASRTVTLRTIEALRR